MPPSAKKHRLAHREHTSRDIPGVLSDFHCHCVAYNFRFSKGSIDTKKFSRETGIEPGDTWSTALPPKSDHVGYHVHFDGKMTDKVIDMTVRYVDGQMKPAPESAETPPILAESFMLWLGGFVEASNFRANVWAHFDKPSDTWRPRFNLPFKVTMADKEVTIDEVSIVLPQNQFRATRGRLGTIDNEVIAWVSSVQSVEFNRFDIGEQVAIFNEAIKMFVEQKL